MQEANIMQTASKKIDENISLALKIIYDKIKDKVQEFLEFNLGIVLSKSYR